MQTIRATLLGLALTAAVLAGGCEASMAPPSDQEQPGGFAQLEQAVGQTRYIAIDSAASNPQGGGTASGVAASSSAYVPNRFIVVGITNSGELTYGVDPAKSYSDVFALDQRLDPVSVPLSKLASWINCNGDCSFVLTWDSSDKLIQADIKPHLIEPIFCWKLPFGVHPDPSCYVETCGNGCCRDDEDVQSCPQDCDLPYSCDDYCIDQDGCGYVGPGLVWASMKLCQEDCRRRNCTSCLECIGKHPKAGRCDADCSPDPQVGCKGGTTSCGTSSLCGG